MDYAKLWRTLMRTGINQRFSQIRSEFFMKIATDGVWKFKGKEDLEKIIDDSKRLKDFDDIIELVRIGIREGDEFKYHSYSDDKGTFLVEYFANVSDGLSKEFINAAMPNDGKRDRDDEIDAYCNSYLFDSLVENEDGEKVVVGDPKTMHFIYIGEGSSTINPDNYPAVIKHELTHACLFELHQLIKAGYFDNAKVPATWTDAEIEEWKKDIMELNYALDNEKDGYALREFIAEFLMYESDGQTKEKNPIIESRVPRTTKATAKPRVTYRTLSPLDRLEEHLEDNDYYRKLFAPIINALRPVYDKYDEFLDSVKM